MSVQAQTQLIKITNKIGRQMWVWDSDSFYTQRLRAGPYQKQNLMHLRALCPQPRKMLDIGMNIGMNTWEYATFAQEVHSFEPVPATYQVALDNIALNINHQDPAQGWWKQTDGTWASLLPTAKIQTYNVALGPVPGTVEMHIKKNDGHNRVSNDGYKTVTGRAVKVNTGYQRVSVPLKLTQKVMSLMSQKALVTLLLLIVLLYKLSVLRHSLVHLAKQFKISLTTLTVVTMSSQQRMVLCEDLSGAMLRR